MSRLNEMIVNNWTKYCEIIKSRFEVEVSLMNVNDLIETYLTEFNIF